MWTPFLISSEPFMLKFNETASNYEIQLTDLKKLWCGDFPENVLIQKFQECNPMFDVKSEEVLIQIRKIFRAVDQAQIEVDKNESSVHLNIKANISEFKFKFEIALTKTEDGKFMEMITIPMIQTVHFLELQQKMLCNLIKKKDRELEEYQMEKGIISRSDLITKKFEPETLISSSETLILNVFESSNKFMDHINKKYGEVSEKVEDVDMESWNQKKKKRKIYNCNTAKKSDKIIYKA